MKRKKNNGLLKVGEMAREAGVLPSTIRYYTKIGLLTPAQILPSKYHLYEPEETLNKLQYIRRIMGQKPTLQKIREQISNPRQS